MAETFRAPGRVNLIGEHTDYSGGLVLPAVLELGLSVTGEPGDDVVALTSQRFEGEVAVPADGSRGLVTGWGRYVAAVVAELAEAGRAPVGFRGRVEADLPAGAGLASSAALEVAVARALSAAAGFSLPPLELVEACRSAEERAVGVPCGPMDQAAAILGRPGQALLLDCGSMEHRLVPLPEELALLILDSGVSRRLEHTQYARRRAEVEAGHPRRIRHVESENERVRGVVECFESGADRDTLGRLFAESHASLRDDFEVSTAELDLLVELALEAGAVAARMTGAGFGGSIVALAEADDAEDVARAVADAYGHRTGRTACWHLDRRVDEA